MNYYYLKKGEIIEPGDEIEISNDGWRGAPVWVKADRTIGQPAPDPDYVSHRKYRRKMEVTPNA